MSRAQKRNHRLVFGAKKYAGYHLLLCRWLRHYARRADYTYVTLGGTELRDCESLFFIDPCLITSSQSYEQEHDRHALAVATKNRLAAKSIIVEVIHGDLFEKFTRNSERPHIFFFDFEGIFGTGFDQIVSDLFQGRVIREGDTVFVTSYLGRNVGYRKIFEGLLGEFSVLGASDEGTRKELYRWCHPTFTLYRGLEMAGFATALSLKCFGCVHYNDTSPMGVWGYQIEAGKTQFARFVNDSQAVRFDIANGMQACI